MPFRLDKIFTTVTSNPTRAGNYIEIEPCDALKPYIRCFWGSKHNKRDFSDNKNKSTLVIPDVCMDIMVTGNQDLNSTGSYFAVLIIFLILQMKATAFVLEYVFMRGVRCCLLMKV